MTQTHRSMPITNFLGLTVTNNRILEIGRQSVLIAVLFSSFSILRAQNSHQWHITQRMPGLTQVQGTIGCWKNTCTAATFERQTDQHTGNISQTFVFWRSDDAGKSWVVQRPVQDTVDG